MTTGECQRSSGQFPDAKELLRSDESVADCGLGDAAGARDGAGQRGETAGNKIGVGLDRIVSAKDAGETEAQVAVAPVHGGDPQLAGFIGAAVAAVAAGRVRHVWIIKGAFESRPALVGVT